MDGGTTFAAEVTRPGERRNYGQILGLVMASIKNAILTVWGLCSWVG